MDARTEIGPKAESLRRMADAGLPVPEARFLAADAYREHALRAGIASLTDPSEIRAALEAAPVSVSVVSGLTAIHAALGGGPVAVRSSGTAEDMPAASFAGQHGTYFVADGAHLPGAVRDCWASLFSERAVRYREHAAIGDTDVAMAVIIQRLVPARSAGVAFTVDPLDGSDRVLVESCFGIGESLVSGKVTPDTFTFERERLCLEHRSTGMKPERLVVGGDGIVVRRGLDAGSAAAPSIGESTAREVAALALAAERLFGVPVDVEWAFDGDRVWLLQARPVTAILGSPRPAADTPPAAEPIIWSNVNTGEILPDVASPMTWSIIHGHAQDVFGGMFDALGVHLDAQKLIGLVGGRIYFNLSLFRTALAHIPALDLTSTLGGMQDFVELPPVAEGTRPSRRAVVRAAVGFPGYILGHTPRKAERFLAKMRAVNEDADRVLASQPGPDEALELALALLNKFDSFNESLAFTMVGMIGFGALSDLCRRWFADESHSLANLLVAGRGDVASAEAGHALWRLGSIARERGAVRSALQGGGDWDEVRSRLEDPTTAEDAASAEFLGAWDAFMAEHGHHRRGELEFANPTWSETPDYVLGVVRGYLASPGGDDPIAAYAARAAAADEAAAACLAALRDPIKRAVFVRALAWGRSASSTRENAKSVDVRWLVTIRRALLALADHLVTDGTLAQRQDIFFLRIEEVEPIVAGPQSQDWRALVAVRRAEHDRLAALTPPPVVIGEWDEDEASWQVRTGVTVLKGMSVSAGFVRGPARVFSSADTDETVLPGEILVAPFTDPGWTPYFVPAAGIVMDMGGLLSHGSIIAREYGIPAVVNVGPATRIIRTGQIIEVDCDAGEVRIVG